MIINIMQIVDPERVDSLLKPGAVLSSIEYSFPIPSVEILRELKLSEFQIAALSETNAATGHLVIKAQPRMPLSKTREIISGVVEAFKGSAQEKQTLLRGKELNGKTQPYRFGDDYVTYQITLPTAKTESGNSIPLSIEEMVLAAREVIITTYKNNRSDLLMYAGKI